MGIFVFLGLLLTGCSNEDFSPEVTTSADATFKNNPKIPNAGSYVTGGRLFDLETAPNNDILVADATRGILDIYGNLQYELVQITSVSTVGTGLMWATIGPRDDDPAGDHGQALYLVQKNRSQLVLNLYDFEVANNPDGGLLESNPYAVEAISGNKALVADAAANDLLRVDRKGNVEVLAIFPEELVSTANIKNLLGCPTTEPFPPGPCSFGPQIPAQAVPTSIAIGPDGYYYVGELKGFPSPIGESNIWRISPDAYMAECGNSPDCVKLFDGGFTSIIDLAFDKNGILYVAEMDAMSWFAMEIGAGVGGTIKACDPETLECIEVATGIPMLTAITFDKQGRLWATQNSLIPHLAGVVHVPL